MKVDQEAAKPGGSALRAEWPARAGAAFIATCLINACAEHAPIPAQWDQHSQIRPVEMDRAFFAQRPEQVRAALDAELAARGSQEIAATPPHQLVVAERVSDGGSYCADGSPSSSDRCAGAGLGCHTVAVFDGLALTIDAEGAGTRVRVFVRTIHSLDNTPPGCSWLDVPVEGRFAAMDFKRGHQPQFLLEAVRERLDAAPAATH